MILLIQFRTDQSGPHEVQCFYDTLGLPYNKLRIVNVSDQSLTSEMLQLHVNQANGVILGGWGDVSFSSEGDVEKKQLRHAQAVLKPVLKEIQQDENKALLGICFGCQIVCEARGSIVRHDQNQAESGVVGVILEPEGVRDPLFEGMSDTFFAASGHHDSVINAPEGSQLLARTQSTRNCALKIGKKQYAVMFHPELNHESVAFRLNLYPQYKEHLQSEDPVDEKSQPIFTDKILHNFVRIAESAK